MKKSKLFLVFLILVLKTQFVLAISDTIKNERIDFRLDKLEEHQSIEKDKFDVYKDKIDFKLTEFESDYSWLAWIFGGSFGFVAIAGLILWLYNLPKKINKLAEEKANEKLSTYFEEKRSKIETIVKNADEDDKLKKEKKIIVVSKKEDDNSFLISFLKQFKFKADFIDMDEYQKINEDYDIILLNNENDDFSTNIESFLDDLKPNTLLFSFGKSVRLSDEKNMHFSSATFRSQLYGNLMSALRYQKFMD